MGFTVRTFESAVSDASWLLGFAFSGFRKIEVSCADSAHFLGVFLLATTQCLDETLLANQALFFIKDETAWHSAGTTNQLESTIGVASQAFAIGGHFSAS